MLLYEGSMPYLLCYGQKDKQLTAVVEYVEFGEVIGTEAHPLANHIHELWDLGDYGGLRADVEGRLAVVHHRAIVIGNIQSAGLCVIACFEVVLFT